MCRVRIPLLGILLCERPSRYATPQADSGIEWTNVAFRLTLGWISQEAATSSGSDTLALEKFEIGGTALVSGVHSALPGDVEFQYSATLFFEEAASLDCSVRDSRPDLDFVNVSGEDVHKAHVANDAYFRPVSYTHLTLPTSDLV